MTQLPVKGYATFHPLKSCMVGDVFPVEKFSHLKDTKILSPLKKVIEEANIELKANAIKMGANAILGYDLNLTTTSFGSKNFVLVSVSGTAVETA